MNDPKGQRIAYEYNKLNRLIKTKYYNSVDPAHGGINPVKVISFSYDELGNLKTYNDGLTSRTYTYDDLNRKLSETVNYGAFSRSHSYTYYANGLKKSFTGPGNIEYTYTYDQNNRLAAINIPGLGNITYQAFKWNSPIKVAYPGGAGGEYQYDPLMRIKKILEYDPARNPVMTREYEYSQGDNVLSKKTEHGDYSYGYDELYRLNRETRPDFADNRQLVTDDYSYDAIGNRLSKTGIPGAWTYNANAELLAFGNTGFNYDLNGNLTNKTNLTNGTNETAYIYDIADQLIQVQDGAGAVIADYAYDPFGRRLWKDVDGVRTYFVYSDEGLIAECDQNGSLTKTYGYGPNSQWTTDPLFQKIGDSYYWYKNDSQGTPQKIVDTSGHVVWEARYDAFGNCAIITQEIENNLRLAGQYYDKETGLYYNYHRYYDPVTGRYLQTDPYREGLNLYAYCHNNPNSFIDPRGLCVAKVAWKAIKWFGNAMRQGFWETVNGLAYFLHEVLNSPFTLMDLLGVDERFQEFLMLYLSQAWVAQSISNALGALPVYIGSLLSRGTAGEIAEGTGIGEIVSENRPFEAYNRAKHYGKTPTAADRKAIGAGEGEVVDHQPSLVERYYEGDASIGEKPGWEMTPAERRVSAMDRERMRVQSRSESDAQGAAKANYSKKKKKELEL